MDNYTTGADVTGVGVDAVPSGAAATPIIQPGIAQDTLAINLGFRKRKVEFTNATLIATGSSTVEREITFTGLGQKRKMVHSLNINLGAATVSASIYVQRENANATVSDSDKVPLSAYVQGDTFQSNIATLNTAIWLDVNDKLYLSLTKSDTGNQNVLASGTFTLMD